MNARIVLIFLVAAGAAAAAETPTFTKDVAPILDKHCVTCHRPGEIAPMSLMSYNEVRPWAKVDQDGGRDSGRCLHGNPTDPRGTFSNDRRLDRSGKGNLDRLGGSRRQQGDPKESAGASEIRRRVGDREARRGADHGEAVRGSGGGDRFLISISGSRRTSPRTSGCRRLKFAPAFARWCTICWSSAANRTAR